MFYTMNHFKKNVSALLCTLALVSCEQNNYEPEEVTPPLTQVTEETISLKNGTQLLFKQIDDGDLQGTFILEESSCSSCSELQKLSELLGRDFNTKEAFWAYSTPKTQIPAFLEIKKSDFEQPQGWARNLSLDLPIGNEGTPSRVMACKNSNFTSSIAGGFLGNPEFVALDKTPTNYTGFVNDCASVPASYCSKGPR